MLPNFLGIGAARAGSTWLWRNLSEHPDIFVPAKKEINFFNSHFDEGLEYYEQFFVNWNGERAVGDVTPQYLHYTSVPERVHEVLPNAKLICCLRNPIDRAYSHYWHTKAKSSSLDNSTFEERIEASPEIVPAGLYFDHLARYLSLFPRDQVHVFIFEEIAKNADRLLRDIYRFLEVDYEFVSPVAFHRVNAAASQGNLSRSRILWNASRILKRLNAYTLEKRIESFNYHSLPPMSPDTQEHLRRRYREQVLQLENLLDMDLSCWEIT